MAPAGTRIPSPLLAGTAASAAQGLLGVVVHRLLAHALWVQALAAGDFVWGAEVSPVRTAPPSEASGAMGVVGVCSCDPALSTGGRSWKWGLVANERASSAGRSVEGLARHSWEAVGELELGLGGLTPVALLQVSG